MTTELIIAVIIWTSVTGYALLGGADFGAGIWDLLAGGRRAGAQRRALIEHSIGPVWEANHVWLIFVLVLLWTTFPPVFAAISSTLYLPLTFVALGVIARGSAFAFRKAIDQPWAQQLFGVAFAFSSVVTPWFLGAAAGAVAAGRVPPGLARGGAISSWLNPVSAVTGTFAVTACAFLAASYLTLDARRAGQRELAAWFRRRALASGLLVGGCSVAGLAVLRADAPALYARLTGPALPLTLVAVAAGLAAIALAGLGGLAGRERRGLDRRGLDRRNIAGRLLAGRRLAVLRLVAALAVAAVLWAWAAAQYPYLLPPGSPVGGRPARSLTLHAAAAPQATLTATVICAVIGCVLVLPSLAWLLILAQRQPPRPGSATRG